MGECLFCQIDKGSVPAEKVYDDGGVFAIKDINPQAPIHLLIIPEKTFFNDPGNSGRGSRAHRIDLYDRQPSGKG